MHFNAQVLQGRRLLFVNVAGSAQRVLGGDGLAYWAGKFGLCRGQTIDAGDYVLVQDSGRVMEIRVLSSTRTSEGPGAASFRGSFR